MPGRAPRDFPNRGVRKGVSFWNVFGVPSRGVRQRFGGRTVVFEKDAHRARRGKQPRVSASRTCRSKPLHCQHVTSTGTPKQKSLTPLCHTRQLRRPLGQLADDSVNPSHGKLSAEFKMSNGNVKNSRPSMRLSAISVAQPRATAPRLW